MAQQALASWQGVFLPQGSQPPSGRASASAASDGSAAARAQAGRRRRRHPRGAAKLPLGKSRAERPGCASWIASFNKARTCEDLLFRGPHARERQGDQQAHGPAPHAPRGPRHAAVSLVIACLHPAARRASGRGRRLSLAAGPPVRLAGGVRERLAQCSRAQSEVHAAPRPPTDRNCRCLAGSFLENQPSTPSCSSCRSCNQQFLAGLDSSEGLEGGPRHAAAAHPDDS